MFTRLRGMERSDLTFAAECSRAAGRVSATIEQFESFLFYNSTDCFVAENNQGLVGFCVAVRYGRCGFLGVVAQGGVKVRSVVERELLEHARAHLAEYRCEHIIVESGHSIVPAFKNAGCISLGRILRFVGHVYARSHQHVRPMRLQDLSTIAALDRHCFRADRWIYLERKYSLAPQFCKIIETSRTIGGYIMGHRAEGVLSVGPWVVSSTVDCPADLLEGLALEAIGETMFIEVLETNCGAVELLRAMGFVELPDWAWRLRLGPRSAVGLGESLYAIGSPFMG